MGTELILILLVIIIGFVAIFVFLNQKLKDSNEPDPAQQAMLEWLKTTQAEMGKMQSEFTKTMQQSDKNVTDTLQKSYKEMNERLDKAAKVIGDLKEETGKFSEIGRSMRDLQDFLNAPKLRGNIGEQVLSDLLGQMLPKQAYALQYRFDSGDIVDAVIKTQAGLVSVDSKFPMENFSKMSQAESAKEQEKHKKQFVNDVRKHIRDISTKYIRSAEDTVDFALMYVPSESMYYEITANTPELSDYAQERRVLSVSPSTFYAFLRTILVSFEGQRIAKEAQSILQNLRHVQKASSEFGEHLSVLSRHVSNAYKNMGDITTEYSQLQQKIDHTRSLGMGLQEKAEELPS